ncbi:MAG: hypothetical protein E6J55_12995 [Deltaproteobacteria bacterium]|nr:MAG: hypothetical protein E6J55_12995 [Deltaproteobacteria bacterium]
MFEGVGRRQDATRGLLVNIGQHSLNGYERNVLFRNDGDGTFTDVAFVNAVDRVEDGRGLSIFDYDRLLHNLGGRGHWIQLELIGVRSNRDAVGARVRLQTARGWQTRQVSAGSAYLSGQSLVQHFGLGTETTAAEVDIRWPSGLRTSLCDLAADRRYTVVEGTETPFPAHTQRTTARSGPRRASGSR